MTARAKRPSGGASMTAAGKRPVQLWFTPAELDQLRTAAEAEGRAVTQLLSYHGLQAAKKILAKIAKSG